MSSYRITIQKLITIVDVNGDHEEIPAPYLLGYEAIIKSCFMVYCSKDGGIRTTISKHDSRSSAFSEVKVISEFLKAMDNQVEIVEYPDTL